MTEGTMYTSVVTIFDFKEAWKNGNSFAVVT